MFARWLRIGQSASEPDAERRDRGTLTFKPGGAGVADVLRLLRKNASDTYERVTLATMDDIPDVPASHDPVTVTDTASIDLTLSGQQVSASVLPGGVSHNSLAGLTTGDPHTQYVKKAGDTITGDLTVRHRLAGGVNPSLAVGSAAGSGASTSVAGCDDGFRIVLVTGSSGLGSGVLVTVTFATARASSEYAVSLTAGDSDAAVAATKVYIDYSTRTATTCELRTTGALPASTSHVWFVTIVEAA